MAREFVRSVKNVKDINTINDNITEENDLISDMDGNVYIRKKVGYQKLNVANDKDTNEIKKLNKKIDFLEYDLNGVKIDLSNYAKLSDIPESQDLSTYAKKTDLTVYNKKIDTINWQHYKLTNDDGTHPIIDVSNNLDILYNLNIGNYYTNNTPINGSSSKTGFLKIMEQSAKTVKFIIFIPYNSSEVWIKRYYNKWYDWEKLPSQKDINNLDSKIKVLEERLAKLEKPKT